MSPAKMIDRARAAWGEALPEWVAVLAQACDGGSQRSIARMLGYSPATISLVLSNTYAADLHAIEQTVRGLLMASKVSCPVVGEMAADMCQQHQERPWAPNNPQRITFYRACRNGCPNSRLGGSNAE